MPKVASTGFYVLSLAWLMLAMLVSRQIAYQPLWLALVCTVLLAAPVFFAGMYSQTIKKIQRAEIFHQRGVLYYFMTGRLLAFVVWTLWAFGSTFIMLFYLSTISQPEWGILVLALPVFLLLYGFNSKLVGRELKTYITVHFSLLSSRVMLMFIMAVLNVGVVMLSAETATLNQSPGLNIVLNTESNSVLITETLRFLYYIDSIKKLALSHLSTLNGAIYSFFIFTGSAIFFFNIALVFSSFIVPVKEYGRIFAPLQNIAIPPTFTPAIALRATAIITFILFFICIPAIAYLELWLKSNPKSLEELHAKENIVAQLSVEMFEKIGDQFYQLGTIEKITARQISLLQQLDISMEEVQAQSDLGYKLMANNVDNYLDWYYSLVGEYTRIFALLNGEIEEMMAAELQEQLMQGDAFSQLEESITNTIADHAQLSESYQRSVEEILLINKVNVDADRIEVQEFMPIISVLTPPEHAGLINLKTRLLVSGAAGAALTGAVAAKITAKVIGKGTIKLGAKALTKIVAGKATSAAGGTALGAALGSVVPGLGTVVGGVAGGIVGGVVIGLSVEQLLLKLEEAFSREAFEQEILDSIEAARLEFNNALL